MPHSSLLHKGEREYDIHGGGGGEAQGRRERWRREKSSFNVPTPILQDITTLCKYPKLYLHLQVLPQTIYFLGDKIIIIGWYLSFVPVFQSAAGRC